MQSYPDHMPIAVMSGKMQNNSDFDFETKVRSNTQFET